MAAAQFEQNYSGFSGYGYGNLYPNMGMLQSEDTIPEPEEQQAYTQADSPAPPAVDQGTKTGLYILIAFIFLAVVVLGRG